MHLQRSGDAESPEVHIVLTSSLSALLKGRPIRLGQVQAHAPVIKSADP
ncbi:hypothetical protein [Lentibacillus jeotgali]|nr:hypothetical protein [Lentibacillus jeotgali]